MQNIVAHVLYVKASRHEECHLSERKSKASKEEKFLKYGTFKIFQFPLKISKSNNKHDV